MDYAALWAEIQANPACAAYITPSFPKVSAEIARINDQIIADILNEGRTKIVRREVGEGAISLALGVPDGPVFVYNLRKQADVVLPGDAAPEQVALVALAQQTVRSLSALSFDVGHPDVRAGIDAMVGSLLTADQAEKIKDLAVVSDAVTAADVSRAVRGPRE